MIISNLFLLHVFTVFVLYFTFFYLNLQGAW